jgi:hypothetical protein
MKKIYLLIVPCILLLITACSKDFLKSYDKRITGGTWELHDVDNFGIGSRYNAPFTNGFFTFLSSGELEYRDTRGNVYEGTWDIRYDRQQDPQIRRLTITVTDFNTRDVLSESFDNIEFTGTNRFKALINNGSRTYTFRFKR